MSNNSNNFSWESSWDIALKTLVRELSFDFEKIAIELNKRFKVGKFTKGICQLRWKEIHMMRKKLINKTDISSGDVEAIKTEGQDNIEGSINKLEEIHNKPEQIPSQKTILQEILEKLPAKRRELDLLDKNKIYEFDRQYDITTMGEKIIPGNFNILKDKIRVRDEEFKKKEQDFLKSLENLATQDDELDFSQPFVFKANFENGIKIEKFELNEDLVKDKLAKRIDLGSSYSIYDKKHDELATQEIISETKATNESIESKPIDVLETKPSNEVEPQASGTSGSKANDALEPKAKDTSKLKGNDTLELKANDATEQKSNSIEIDQAKEIANLKSQPKVQVDNWIDTMSSTRAKKELDKLFDINPNIDEAVSKFEQLQNKIYKGKKEEIIVEKTKTTVMISNMTKTEIEKKDNVNEIKRIMDRELELRKQEEDELRKEIRNQTLMRIELERQKQQQGYFKGIGPEESDDDSENDEDDNYIEKIRNDIKLKTKGKDKGYDNDDDNNGLWNIQSQNFMNIEDKGIIDHMVDDDNDNDNEENNKEIKVRYVKEKMNLKNVGNIEKKIEKENVEEKVELRINENQGKMEIQEVFPQVKEELKMEKIEEMVGDQKENELQKEEKKEVDANSNFKSSQGETGLIKKEESGKIMNQEEQMNLQKLDEKKNVEEMVKNDIDEIERRKREKRQQKIDEQAIKLANLLKEVKKKNQEFEEIQEETVKKAQEEEQKAAIEEEHNRRKLFEDALKNQWTNSYVKYIYDEKIMYGQSVLVLDPEVFNKITKEGEMSSRERILSRYQVFCFPILYDQTLFLHEILDYFLKFSRLNKSLTQDDRYNNFQYKLLSFLFTSSIPNKRDNIKIQIENRQISQELYLLFDTFDGRGQRLLEEVMKTKLLREIFSKEIIQQLIKENMIKDKDATLADIMIFHYKNLELVKDIFTSECATSGICCEPHQYDQYLDNYEYSMVLLNYLTTERLVPKKTQKTEKISNLATLIKRLISVNLSIIGIKSVFMTEDAISTFKSKIGPINIESGECAIALAIGGYKAITKTKSIVGTSDQELARKLEPRSINGLFSLDKTNKAICPTNKGAARKWISYFFGGRLNPNMMRMLSLEDLKSANWVYSYPYQVMTTPLKKIIVIMPCKEGSQITNCISMLSEIGCIIQDMRILSNIMIKNLLESCDNNIALSFYQILQDYSFEYSQFKDTMISSNTTNIGNTGIPSANNAINTHIFIEVIGIDTAPINRLLLRKCFGNNPMNINQIKKNIFVTSNEVEVDKISKMFFRRDIYPEEESFTKCYSMKTYLYILPIKNEQIDFLHFGEDITTLGNEKFELLGAELVNGSKLANNTISEIIYDTLKQNIIASNYFKKRIEFNRFIKKVYNYLIQKKLLIAAFRIQNPCQNPETTTFKKPLFANSNFNIPESFIISEGKTDENNELVIETFEKLMLDITLNNFCKITHELRMHIGDDIGFKSSFIYDLPMENKLEPISTLLIVSEKAVKFLTSYFLFKFFESKKFNIEWAHYDIINNELRSNIEKTIFNNNDGETIMQEDILDSWNKQLDKPCWMIVLQKANGIFECKHYITELLNKISIFDDANTRYIKKLSTQQQLIYYGIYCSRGYNAWEIEYNILKKTQMWLYNDNNNNRLGIIQANNNNNNNNTNKIVSHDCNVILFKENESLLTSTMINASTITSTFPLSLSSSISSSSLTTANTSISTSTGAIEIHTLFNDLSYNKLRIINMRFIAKEQIHNEMNFLIEIFKKKHDAEALRTFLTDKINKIILVAIEYSKDSNLNDILGSFRFKGPNQIQIFNKGSVLEKYGSNFLTTQFKEDIMKLLGRYFNHLDSDYLKLEHEIIIEKKVSKEEEEGLMIND